MSDLTFVTPVSTSHLDRLQRAVDSVRRQTVHCEHVIVFDPDRLGPGAARNVGLLQVKTPFVSFLDADDEVVPDFAERMLSAFDGVHYVYCDWVDGQGVKHAPPNAWVTEDANGERHGHIITTLLPTAWALEVGGFDVTLPGGEDTDFYLKMIRAGHCGKLLRSPLFTYGDGGERSKRFRFAANYRELTQIVFERYKGTVTMACCGQNDRPPVNSQQDGWVLAVVSEQAPAGNQRRRGLRSGNVYARSGVGDTLYVDPVDFFPGSHFVRVETKPEPDGNADAVLEALELLGTPAARLPVFNPSATTTNIGEVLRLWGAPVTTPSVEAEVKVVIPDDPAERLKLVEEEHLSDAEFDALVAGDEVVLKTDGTARVVKKAPTARKPRTARK